MIWHIFRKDVRLLWKLAAGVAALNLAERVNLSSAGPFFRASVSPQVMFAGELTFLGTLATVILIVMAVQQDPIPGVTQDWLARPIRRRDLLLSKILFALLMVQLPIFVIEVVQCVAAGFPMGPSFTAPIEHSAWIFLAVDLPVIAFATLTAGFAQAAGAALATAVGCIVFWEVTTFGVRANVQRLWGNGAEQLVCALAGVAAVLALQYFGRKTARARWVIAAAVLVWLSVPFMPLQSAWAMVRGGAAEPAGAAAIRLTDSRTHIIIENQDGLDDSMMFGASGTTGETTGGVPVWASVQVEGISGRLILLADSRKAVMTLPSGAKYDFGRQTEFVYFSPQGLYEDVLVLPNDIYQRVNDQPVEVRIEYSLTRHSRNQTGKSVTMPEWASNY